MREHRVSSSSPAFESQKVKVRVALALVLGAGVPICRFRRCQGVDSEKRFWGAWVVGAARARRGVRRRVRRLVSIFAVGCFAVEWCRGRYLAGLFIGVLR